MRLNTSILAFLLIALNLRGWAQEMLNEVTIEKTAKGSLVAVNGKLLSSALENYEIAADTWAVSENGLWFSYPLFDITRKSKQFTYKKYFGLALLGSDRFLKLSHDELISFQGWSAEWFEISKVFLVSRAGDQIVVSIRRKLKNNVFRSDLVLIDTIKRKCIPSIELSRFIFPD